jgi:hypothetical protein
MYIRLTYYTLGIRAVQFAPSLFLFSYSFEHLLSLLSFLRPFRHGPDSPMPNRATASSCVSAHRIPLNTALKNNASSPSVDRPRESHSHFGLSFLSSRLLRCPSGLILVGPSPSNSLTCPHSAQQHPSSPFIASSST